MANQNGAHWRHEKASKAFHTGQVVVVSDGSYMHTTRATTWTIEAATASNRIVSTGYTPGVERNQSAYQSELFGLWGILHTVKKFITGMGLTKGPMTIACDGLSALKQAQYQQYTDPTVAHYDLIGAICQLQDMLPVDITFEHVKGHQDNSQSLALLWTTWMNIKMDAWAKQKAQTPYQGPAQYNIPFKGWRCKIQGQRQLKNLLISLQDHINGITIQQHWATKRQYGHGTANMVDWEATDITNGIMMLGIQIGSEVPALQYKHATMENKIKCTVSTMSGGKQDQATGS